MPVRTIIILALGLSCKAAVIEVTAGGAVNDPTYRFSDIAGSSVATLTGDTSTSKITASGAFASTEYVIHSGGPTDSQLIISSCTATSTFPGRNCEKAYDGVSSYINAWLTQAPAPADSAITITLSNVSAQSGRVTHPPCY